MRYVILSGKAAKGGRTVFRRSPYEGLRANGTGTLTFALRSDPLMVRPVLSVAEGPSYHEGSLHPREVPGC